MLDRWFKPRPHAVSVDGQLEAADAAYSAGDYETALAGWVRLAHAGNAIAQRAIGRCFLQGTGVARDAELAFKWLRLSAEAGNAEGQRQLAEFLFNGEDGVPNKVEAKAWYRRSALQGNAPAQDMLSRILADDELAPDYAQSREWALLAAAQGVASSMTRLGFFFHNALGVERDRIAAALWWERAAYRGDGDGQAMLGAAYHLGFGRPRDHLEALVWLKRARQNRSPCADRYFEAVWASCTADQRAEAARRAAEQLDPSSPSGGAP